MKVQDWCSWYSSVNVGRAIGECTGLVSLVQFFSSKDGDW